MIPYEQSFLNFSLIFRINGSPIFRAFLPGLISTTFFIILETYLIHYLEETDEEAKLLSHPYGVGVLISATSFLIIFRANYGYQRYWEACGSVHQFMSKWLDAVTHTGCYHMQQQHHNHIKPPSYFDNHDLNIYRLSRDREREGPSDFVGRDTNGTLRQRKNFKKERAKVKTINEVRRDEENPIDTLHSDSAFSTTATIRDPQYLLSDGRRDGGWGGMFDDDTSTYYSTKHPKSWNEGKDRGFASTIGGRTHNLFLQELVHLASLCNAVAFSTLRNDVEGTESPLDFYVPGSPWPEVDPDKEPKSFFDRFWDHVRYLSGSDRTKYTRVKHNTLRPMPVLGGVSENEILFLQRARGPSAKVNLAWHWLSEFIIREHLAGSLGKVGPPIISRIFQFLSDGMIFYNHARKIMFIPFPFPHAQISALFVFTIMFTVPLLMDEYSNNIYLGAGLTFLTVTCLAGLHEVGRELENPFRNVPNEIPLVTFQAMFNEALIVLFAGYHPDHFWNGDEFRGNYDDGNMNGYHDKNGQMNGDHGKNGHSSTEESSSKNGLMNGTEKAQDPGNNRARTLKDLKKELEDQRKEIKRLNELVTQKGM